MADPFRAVPGDMSEWELEEAMSFQSTMDTIYQMREARAQAMRPQESTWSRSASTHTYQSVAQAAAQARSLGSRVGAQARALWGEYDPEEAPGWQYRPREGGWLNQDTGQFYRGGLFSAPPGATLPNQGSSSGIAGGIGGMLGRIGGMWAGMGGRGMREWGRADIQSLWRAQAIRGLGDDITRQGRALLDTTKQWAAYAAEAERADAVLHRVAATVEGGAYKHQEWVNKLLAGNRTLAEARAEAAQYLSVASELEGMAWRLSEAIGGGSGSLNEVMADHATIAARMGEELGQYTLPVWEAIASQGDRIKLAFINASDGMQQAGATGTIMAGTFAVVGGSLVALAGAAAATRAILGSFPEILGPGMGAGAVARGVGGIAGGAGLVVGAFAVEQQQIAALRAEESQIRSTAESYGEYLGKMRELYESTETQIGARQRMMALFALERGEVEYLGRAVAATKAEYEAGLPPTVAGPDFAARVAGAQVSMAMAPSFAAVYGNLEMTQKEIQGRMETNRREHAYAMEQIDKYGYSRQWEAQAQALDKQMRQLENANAQAEVQARQAVGALVIQWTDMAMQLGLISPAEAVRRQMEAGVEYGMWSNQLAQAGLNTAEELGLNIMGEQGWGAMTGNIQEILENVISGGVNAETLEISAGSVVLISDRASAPGPGGFTGDKWWQTTPDEEALTQGVRVGR